MEIAHLARTTTARPRYMAEVLRLVAKFYKAPYATVHLRYASEVIHDDCHTGPTDPRFWKTNLQEFLTESLAESRSRAKVLKAKRGKIRVAFLSAPVFDPSGPAIGAMALVVTPIEEAEVATCLARLEGFCRLASACAEFLGGREAGPPGSKASVQAQARAAQCGTTAELAFTITNELRNKLGCEQVALGMVRRNRVKILSISGLDEVKKQSPGVVSLLGAMEECHDVAAPIVFQRDGGFVGEGTSASYRMHKQWHGAAKGATVASIPLRSGERTVAILSIRQRSQESFTHESIEQLRSKVEPFAPALILTHRANRTMAQHVFDTCHETLQAARAPGHIGRKVAAAVVLIAGCWFTFGSMDYELGVPAVVTAAEIRHISSPFDGALTTAHVVEGDHVARGDILCELDHRTLDQEKAQLLAELAMLERVMDKARAEASPFEVKLALAKQELVDAQLDIVTRRIEQATITSPIDGVVVAGDLRKMIGGIVARGYPLFEVAPLDRWTLELQVPEASSEELNAQLSGTFASYARPEDVREFSISRVLASARIHDTKNVYVAEADIDARGDWMRPGMEGVAKINMGAHKVWWIALHRVIDYLRINLWI